MAQQTLLGGDGTTGESGATHNTKANANFTELYTNVGTAQSTADTANSAISNHISDGVAAHAATAISVTPFGSIGSTELQAALEEIAAEAGAVTIPDASETVEGVAELATQAETNTGSDDLRIVTPLKLHTKVIGIQDLFIPATAMWGRNTSGATWSQTEMATSLFNVQALDFDQTTQEFSQFQISLPRKWNAGTVTAEVYWTATAGSGGVVFGLSGGAYSNDDALTVAFGTAQTMTDTLLATNDLHITPTSAAITLAGTPASADFLAFQLSRNPADGSDTLTGDAKVLGIMIHLTTSAAKDA
jgi:hypothetical protein